LTEELDVLRIVTRRLDAAGIAYMVTGSMALRYYADGPGRSGGGIA